ncbi:MAG: hypothetical protein HQ541_22325 [Mariniphaga sp.]|nr:hypothetical protein [Mariniphaga sp.]
MKTQTGTLLKELLNLPYQKKVLYVTGDMIVMQYSSGWSIIQGNGTIETQTGSLELALGGDQLFAFQTEDLTDYTPTFIAGINMNNRSGVFKP